MPYHIRNKNNKKEMKKARNKPLPLELMKHDQFNGFRVDDGRSGKDKDDSKDVQGTEDGL